MDKKTSVISSNLQTQWEDHFHMRNQTWKVLQYSILFFLGVVGLELNNVDTIYLILAYSAVILTSFLGVIIAIHHRRRQKEKFEIIAAHEYELELDTIIQPILEKAHSTWTGRINTSTYIVVMQIALCVISVCLLWSVISGAKTHQNYHLKPSHPLDKTHLCVSDNMGDDSLPDISPQIQFSE